MKMTSFKRTDKKIDLNAAEHFVNDSPAEQIVTTIIEPKKSNEHQEEIKKNSVNKQREKKIAEKERKKEFLLRMPSQLHRQLKIKAAQEDGNMNEMIVAAVNEIYFKNK